MDGSIKSESFYPLELSTGGNISIETGVFTYPSAPADEYKNYYIHGTKTLSSDLDIVASGVLKEGISVTFLYVGSLTLSGNNFTILGTTVPTELAAKSFIARAIYADSVWKVIIYPNFAESAIIGADRLASDSVTTAKILNANVTLAKLEALTSANIILGNASNRPTATAISGDITISNTGVVTIGNSKVLNAMIDSMDAAKLTGTVAAARIAADSLPSTKLADNGRLYSKYSDTGTTATTSSETLGSYTVAADTVSASGQGLRITFGGTFAANGNTKTIAVKFAGNTYSTNAVTAAPNGLDFRGVVEIVRSGATSAVGFSELEIGAVSQGIQKSKAGITWGNDNDFEFIGTNGTSAANDIVLSMVIIEHIK